MEPRPNNARGCKMFTTGKTLYIIYKCIKGVVGGRGAAVGGGEKHVRASLSGPVSP